MHKQAQVAALPLWVGGRMLLTMGGGFHALHAPREGRLLRKIPLCGEREVREALLSAQAALGPWLSLGGRERSARLVCLADELSALHAHFSAMLAEESGRDEEAVRGELDAVLSLLRANTPGAGTPAVIGLAAAGAFPLHLLAELAPSWRAGSTAVVCPGLLAPSVLLALAELSGRCGFPPGVFNIVHGGAEVVRALRAVSEDCREDAMDKTCAGDDFVCRIRS